MPPSVYRVRRIMSLRKPAVKPDSLMVSGAEGASGKPAPSHSIPYCFAARIMGDRPRVRLVVSFPHQNIQADAHADGRHLYHAGAVAEKGLHEAPGAAHAPGHDRHGGRGKR